MLRQQHNERLRHYRAINPTLTRMSELRDVNREAKAIFMPPPCADQIVIFTVQHLETGQLFRVFRNTEQPVLALYG